MAELNDLYKEQAALQEQRQNVVNTLHSVAREIHALEAKAWLERQGLTESAILSIQGISSGSKVGEPGNN